VARRFEWLALYLIGGFFAWFALLCVYEMEAPQPSAENRSRTIASSRPLSVTNAILPSTSHWERPARVVYPYSVIPGGVKTIADLKNAISQDPVVSAHYALFRLPHARVIRLKRARSMHVSYRFGNRIYWTKRTLKLAKGETVITDGVHTARTRCGNLVSAKIVEPISRKEPTAQEFDTPRLPQGVGVELAPGPQADPPVGEGSSSSYDGIIPILLWAPGSPGGNHEPDPPVPPPVAVPEPGTLALLLAGLVALVLLRKS
jgi:hypothetical protein